MNTYILARENNKILPGKNRSLLIRIINTVLLITTLSFVGFFFYKNLTEILNLDFRINLKFFFISLLSIWAWLSLSMLSFNLLIKKIAPDVPIIENLRIWSTSYLAMYIPGKMGVFALRASNYQRSGISAAKVGYVTFIEMIIAILSAVFIVLLSSIFNELPLIKDNIYVVIILLLLLLTAIHPRLISFYTSIYFRYIKKTGHSHESPFNYFIYIQIILLQLLKWIFVGFGLFFLINSVVDISPKYIPFITGLYAFAAISGMVAFFTPSGFGVLEGIMILGLKTIFANSWAGLISVLIRLWKITGELTFIIVVRFFLWIITKRELT